MNATALVYALQILQALPALLAAGQNVKDLLAGSSAKIQAMIDEKRDPTPEEWDELNDEIASLRGQLHDDL